MADDTTPDAPRASFDYSALAERATHRHPATGHVAAALATPARPDDGATVHDVHDIVAGATYTLLNLIHDDTPELTVALRKLLEARDSLVRCAAATDRALGRPADE